mgnify:CR=1 FL=1
METVISELINDPKVPKWIRFIAVAAVCGFVAFVGVALAIKSQLPAGKVFGGALCMAFIAVAVYLFFKIARSGSER